MRVLHITAGNIYGGIGITIETLALESEACPRMKPEVGLCYRGRFALSSEAAGIPLHYLGETRTRQPWTIVRARKALNRVIRNRRSEVLVTHASLSHAVYAPLARELGDPETQLDKLCSSLETVAKAASDFKALHS